jgi:hypothetical protein
MIIRSYKELLNAIDEYLMNWSNQANKEMQSVMKDESLTPKTKMELVAKIASKPLPDKNDILENLPVCVQFNDKLYLREDKPSTKMLADSHDKVFLHEVNLFNTAMYPLAKELLKSIRNWSPGELRKEETNRYVETPDNFWAVINQVNNKNLRINIYGKPEDYSTRVRLTHYDRSYSYFTISNRSDLTECINMIKKAKELKRRRN